MAVRVLAERSGGTWTSVQRRKMTLILVVLVGSMGIHGTHGYALGQRPSRFFMGSHGAVSAAAGTHGRQDIARGRVSTTRLGLATSSQQLKRGERSKKSKKKTTRKKKTKASSDHQEKISDDSVAFAGVRLARATARATALQEHQKSLKEKQQGELDEEQGVMMGGELTTSSSSGEEKLGSLLDLTRVIDERLNAKNRRARSFNDGLATSAQDPMSFLLGYNDRVEARGEGSSFTSRSNKQDVTFHVGLVFGKPLVRDMITTEYAFRIRALVQNMIDTQNDAGSNSNQFSLLCFSGGVAKGNHVSDADAGYVFFRHLLQAQGLEDALDSTEIVLDRASTRDVESIIMVSHEIQKRLGSWVAAAQKGVSKGAKSSRKLKVNVKVMLISTEYHLCNLNNIHHRSPKQSFLQPIEALREEYRVGADEQHLDTKGKDDQDEDLSSTKRKNSKKKKPKKRQAIHAIVDTSWTFHYATYPYTHSRDDVEAFVGRCYMLGQELLPPYMNIKGVVNNVEFFQRDNFLVLNSIRRSLVSHVEELFKASAGFRTDLNVFGRLPSRDGTANDDSTRTLDVVLEVALLSLGRCVDIVRPAGLLVSSVSDSDWAKALHALEHCIHELQTTCDPDRPLDPREWGEIESIQVGSDLHLEDRQDEGDDSDDHNDEDIEEGGDLSLKSILEDDDDIVDETFSDE